MNMGFLTGISNRFPNGYVQENIKALIAAGFCARNMPSPYAKLVALSALAVTHIPFFEKLVDTPFTQLFPRVVFSGVLEQNRLSKISHYVTSLVLAVAAYSRRDKFSVLAATGTILTMPQSIKLFQKALSFIKRECSSTQVPTPLLSNVPLGYPVRVKVLEWGSVAQNYEPADFTQQGILDRSLKQGFICNNLSDSYDEKYADPVDPSAVKEALIKGRVKNQYGVSLEECCVKAVDDITNRPFNPAGRTGLAGRGAWPLWGPNPRLINVVCRIFNNKLQLLVQTTTLEGKYLIPENIWQIKTYQCKGMKSACSNTSQTSLSLGGQLLKDNRNTDNAWLFSKGYGYFLADKQWKPDNSLEGVCWMNLDADLISKLHDSHAELVKLCLDRFSRDTKAVPLKIDKRIFSEAQKSKSWFPKLDRIRHLFRYG
jgi:hypothetical protein